MVAEHESDSNGGGYLVSAKMSVQLISLLTPLLLHYRIYYLSIKGVLVTL